MSDAEAIACTANAYLGVQSRGEMEKAVVYIAEGRIYLTHPKIFSKAKEKIVEALNSLDLQKLQLETSPEEYQDLLERRDMVLDGIDYIPIDYSPFTRWYYYEMERFERECTNTPSENIVIKTTLAELLIRYGSKENEQFVKIRSELEQFDLNDVGEQLTDGEKADLSIRIKEVLSKR